MSLRCASCGNETEDDARFCPSCGAPVGIGASVAADDAEGVAELTGVLGVRSASEGDSAPLQAVSEQSVSGLPEGAAVLLALRGPSEGTRIQLDPAGGVVTVGRSPEAGVFLDDVTVSRRHAEFRPERRLLGPDGRRQPQRLLHQPAPDRRRSGCTAETRCRSASTGSLFLGRPHPTDAS